MNEDPLAGHIERCRASQRSSGAVSIRAVVAIVAVLLIVGYVVRSLLAPVPPLPTDGAGLHRGPSTTDEDARTKGSRSDPSVGGSTKKDSRTDGSTTSSATRTTTPDATSPKPPGSFVVADGSRLEGRIVDHDGAPLSGIAIRLLALDGVLVKIPRDLHLETVSEDSGHFSFRELPASLPLALEVDREGYAKVLREIGVFDVGRVVSDVDIVLERGIMLRGIVHDESNRPIAGASIRVELANSAAIAAPSTGAMTTQSDAAGRYEIHGLGRTLYRIAAEHDGFAPCVEVRSLLAITLKPEAHQDLVLRSANGSASGRVVDDAEAPVADVDLRATAETHVVTTRSDAEGRFELNGLADRDYEIVPTKEGTHAVATAHARPGMKDVVVRLARNGGLHGRAVRKDGSIPSDLVAELHRIESGGEKLICRCETNGGDFALRDVVPGKYSLEFGATGACRSRSPEFTIASGQDLDLGVATLGDGGDVHLRVRLGDRGSDPAPDGIACVLVPGDLDPSNPEWQGLAIFQESANRTVTASGEAIFRHVVPGAYTLFVTPEKAAATCVRSVLVHEGETTDAGTVLLSSGGRLVGRVLDVQGASLARVRVTASSADAGSAPLTTLTDGGGYFSFIGLAAGEYRVTLPSQDGVRGTPREASGTVTKDGTTVIEVRVYP